MAPSSFLTYFSLLILLSQTKQASSSSSPSFSCFKSIISFGDSLADTGNLFQLTQSTNPTPSFKIPPYGETFFHRPTGRFSDGRLIIDFIAKYVGLSLVPPFYDGKNSSKHRKNVNFAVAGASALPDSFFQSRGIKIPHNNISLPNQLTWFKEMYLPRFYRNESDRIKYLKSSLVLMGEIGGNDYNHALLFGKGKDLVKTFIPHVVKAISSAITELIKLGAVTIMVPGNFPIGCSGAYLNHFRSENKTDYDTKTGCINWLNTFAANHNTVLKQELIRLRQQNPNITIIYADYYNAAMQFYLSPHKYGFAKGGLEICCPGCGAGVTDPKGRIACEKPSEYVSWDGLHLTEAAYRVIATALVHGSFTTPQLNSLCARPNHY